MSDHYDDAVAAIRSILPPYLNTRFKISGYLDPVTGFVGNDPTVGAPPGKMWVYGYPRGANVVVIASGAVNPRIPNVPLLVGDNHAHQAVAYGVVTDENALRQFGAGFPAISTNPAPSETATQDTPLRLIGGGRALPLNSTTPGLFVFIEASPEVGWLGGNVAVDGGDIPTNPNEFRWAVFRFPLVGRFTPGYAPTYALTTAVTKPTKGDLLLSDAAQLALDAGDIRGGAVSLTYGQTDLTADQSRFENELRRNFVPEDVVTVDTSGASVDDVATWDGSHWIAVAPTGGGGGGGTGINKDLFTQTATVTVANTTTPTTLLGAGQGSSLLAANYFRVGRTLVFDFAGIRATALVAPNITFEIDLGSTVMCLTATFADVGSLSGQQFHGHVEITCVTTGSSGTVSAQGWVELNSTATVSLRAEMVASNPVTLNTTVSQQVKALVTWGTASASNTISATQARLQTIDPNVSSSASALALVILKDLEAQNTDGGTFTSGAWRTRVLNTICCDTGSNCTLSSNQFALLAGTYRIIARAPAQAVNRNQARLYNITDSAVQQDTGGNDLVSESVFAANAANSGSLAIIDGRFTIASTKTFELQHQCQTTEASNGFGVAGNFAQEVYAVVRLEKE